MYYIFRCPLCNRNNLLGVSGTLADRQSISRNCSSCKQEVTWTGSEPLAAEKRQSLAAQKRNGVAFDPGRKATLDDAQPGLGIGTKDDAAELIATAPEAVLIDRYSQGEKISAYSATDAEVKEGVCNGQSLHWIRRILQGGRAEYKVLEQKAASTEPDAVIVSRSAQVIGAKDRAQHVGGATVQKATTPDELKKYSGKAYSDYSDAFDLLVQRRANRDVTYARTLANLGATKTPTGWSFPAGNDKIKKEIDDYATECREIEAAKDKLTAAKQNREAAGVYKSHWDEIARDLDANLRKAAVAKQRRPFSGIVATKQLAREKCAGGVSAFATKLFADTEFKAGICALISAGLKIGIGEGGGSITGHASVVHFGTGNILHIFDPNIGVFSCTSSGHARSTLVRMIDVGWVKIFGWQLDGEFGYTLFEAKQAVVDVAPKQVKVEYVVSPEATAVQNKAVIPASAKPPTVAEMPPPVQIKKPAPQPQSPAQSGPNAGLKRELELARDKPERQLAGPFGVHGSVSGGWVTIPFKLKSQIEAAKLTTTVLVKTGPNNTFAIAKEHLNQLIGMI